ncbi:MAG TPA: tRNA preQ1(34) S-adenosylmethionine ribosyltransferase-isomerase QueA [Deltaproteobacteria bacterium]|nr:tRNA preQ1(34) S-adenosylmethionine ribosyltransferase-isomerase QueA [Deltaproteobacteria bacterium]
MLDDYDFVLPEDRIAQVPIEDRERARLFLLDRSTGRRLAADHDARVRDLPDWLAPGDLVVVNTTRVLPAKLLGRKSTGGAAEALLLPDGPGDASHRRHRALVKCRGRLRRGLAFVFERDGRPPLPATVVEVHERGEVSLEFPESLDPHDWGDAPLPPYIRRSGRAADTRDRVRYQTIYAREPGAVAAPTAGLHFTTGLLDRLAERGIGRAELVLHVGAGTFRPLDARALAEGRLHAERFELPVATCEAIERTRRTGGRVVAVGTTTTRVLESRAAPDGSLRPGSGTTDLFIRPGGRPFRIVDALLTNFHLPRSSLLLLVAAFAGREAILGAYREAIRDGFRFYSYGDAMLVFDPARGDRR